VDVVDLHGLVGRARQGSSKYGILGLEHGEDVVWRVS